MTIQTFTRENFSSNESGTGILMYQSANGDTSSTQRLIHAAGVNANNIYEVWLYAVNVNTTSTGTLTIEWGCAGTVSAGGVVTETASGSEIIVDIPPKSGATLIIPGFIIRGNAVELLVTGKASIANSIVVHGFVNLIENASESPA